MKRREKRQGWKAESFPSLLAVRQVAQLLAVHVNTVRKWADHGIIPVYRVGPRRDRRFRREDAFTLLKDSRRAAERETYDITSIKINKA